MWNEIAETYDKIDGYVIFNQHHQINTISQSGSKLYNYYHEIKSPWREYDAMVKLYVCTCAGAGLLVITREVLFRSLRPGDNRRFNNSNALNPNLICKNCNMTDHTIERCFELIGYPPNFNNKSVTGQSGTNNVSVNSKDVDTSVGTSHTLTSDQYERLMSLLSDTGSGSMAHANVAGFSSIVPGGDMPLLSRLTNGNIINCLVSNCLWQNKLGHPADQVLEVLQGRTHLDKVVD
ncbi:hypothetical protein Tco_0462424 [Tanacetum coccineum]